MTNGVEQAAAGADLSDGLEPDVMTKDDDANAAFYAMVARAGMEDLEAARVKFGVDSAEYDRTATHVLGFVRGSIEHILRMALPRLERRARDARSRATRTG